MIDTFLWFDIPVFIHHTVKWMKCDSLKKLCNINWLFIWLLKVRVTFLFNAVQRVGIPAKRIIWEQPWNGDYGHLTIDHAPMLMRRFLSMTEFSQQGFEASHKDQRQLWLKASSHDQHGEASSSKPFSYI